MLEALQCKLPAPTSPSPSSNSLGVQFRSSISPLGWEAAVGQEGRMVLNFPRPVLTMRNKKRDTVIDMILTFIYLVIDLLAPHIERSMCNNVAKINGSFMGDF